MVFITRHPVLMYIAVVFGISWGGGLAIVGPGGLPLHWKQLASLGPWLFVAMLAGPSLAAVLLTGLLYGRAGFRDLVARLLRWRVGWMWYALALLPIVVTATMSLLLALVSEDFRPAIIDASDKTGILAAAGGIGVMFAFCEEIGWTGFATPQLRARHGLFATGLTLGVVWGAWHFPLFWESGSFSGALPFALLLARLFSWLPPLRGLMVWLYDNTKSLPVVMVTHTALVVSQLTLLAEPLAGDRLLLHMSVFVVALWLLLAGARVAHDRQLSRPTATRRAA
jgi:membrane protease YdiL (CAAX protease family)